MVAVEDDFPQDARAAHRLVPLELRGHKVYLSVQQVDEPVREPGHEVEIASRQPKIEQVLDGLAVFAQEVVDRLRSTEASKVSVEFGCEIAVESGTFVAVLGKASAKSAFRITLEWTEPGS